MNQRSRECCRTPRYQSYAAVFLVGCIAALTSCAAPSAPSGGKTAVASPTEVLYLHLYSPAYNVLTDGPGQPERVGNNRRLATVAVSPGVDFYSYAPNYYEPEIELSGVIERDGDSFSGSVKVLVQGVDVANVYEQESPIPVDELVSLFDEGLFYLAISKSRDPYALDYEVEWAGRVRQIR